MLPPVPNFRVGLLGGLRAERDLVERGTCNLASGDLYTYPDSSTTIDATKPLTFKWNTDCTLNSNVDLYLYEPSSANGLIHGWRGVDFSKGEYTVDLQPKWWNDTSSAQLQLSILNAGAPSWDTASPPGPVFKINYAESAMLTATTVNGQAQSATNAAAATNSQDAVFQDVSDTSTGHGISKGAIAAAVIVPLLVLAAAAAVAVRFWRAREAEKRKRWSHAVSSASNFEWEKGALPKEKPLSIIGSGGRPSTHLSMRPGSMATSSIYAVENNFAGAGAGGNYPRPSFSQLRSHSADNLSRSSLMLPDGQVRQSRISFAETARPDRRSRSSLGDSLRPNVGRLPVGSRSATELGTGTPGKKAAVYATGSALDDEEDEINISPSQLQGPNAFAGAEMKRVGQGRRTGRRSIMSFGGSRRNSTASAFSADDFKSAASARGSVDELRDMEAVMLMRRSMMSQYSKGSPAPEAQEQVEALENDLEEQVPPMPTAPLPAAGGSSTVAYGPDQMLAVYAARGKVTASPMPPMPTGNNPKGGMRLLGNLGNKRDETALQSTMPNAPSPGDMRSYVHLNTGTAASSAVGALPQPGPQTPSSLSIPTPSGSWNNVRKSSASVDSTYSDDAEHVGEAR